MAASICSRDSRARSAGVADEDRCVGLLEHGDGIGCGGKECRLVLREFAQEDFGVGEGTAEAVSAAIVRMVERS